MFDFILGETEHLHLQYFWIFGTRGNPLFGFEYTRQFKENQETTRKHFWKDECGHFGVSELDF